MLIHIFFLWIASGYVLAMTTEAGAMMTGRAERNDDGTGRNDDGGGTQWRIEQQVGYFIRPLRGRGAMRQTIYEIII